MSRLNASALLWVMAIGSTACSAITDFERDKIIRAPHDSDAVVNDASMPGDDAEIDIDGDIEMDGEVVEPPQGCDPGWAGDPCEMCPPGQYCAGGSEPPVDCADSDWDHDLNAGTPCVVQRECSPGEFVSAMGSPISDRVCAPCASGRFSTEPNSAQCEGWTDCPVGDFVKTTGTTGSDQVCEVCAPGEYSDAPNSGRCVPYGACAAGSKQTIPGQAGPCTPCAPGEYCAGADALPVVCSNGTWDHDASPASPCAEWTACGPGMSVGTTGTSTINRVCAECPSGTFSATPNATSCTPWSNCEAGTFVSSTGGPAADRTCTACAAGTERAAKVCTWVRPGPPPRIACARPAPPASSTPPTTRVHVSPGRSAGPGRTSR
jgi:hypothetical protein